MATRTIKIYDIIGDSLFFEGISARWFSSEIEKAIEDDTCNEVIVAINSPGGSIFEGIAIYNEIIRINTDDSINLTINTRNDGIAYSMGAIILLAGKTVSAHSNTTMLLHNASGFAMGNAQDLRSRAEMMEAIDTGIAENIADRINKTVEYVMENYLNYKDHTFNASKAHSLGFIDNLIKKQSSSAKNVSNLNAKEAFYYFKNLKSTGAQNNFVTSITNAVKNALSHQSAKTNTSDMKITSQMTALISALNLSVNNNEESTEVSLTDDQTIKLNNLLLKADEDAKEVKTLRQSVETLTASETSLKNEIKSLKKGSNSKPGGKTADDGADDNDDSQNLDHSEADLELAELRGQLKSYSKPKS